MEERNPCLISGEKIIGAIERCLPLIDTEAVREKFLRVYVVLLELRKHPWYFNFCVGTLGFTEKILKKNKTKDDIDGFSELINAPFLFEHISDEDALRVREYLGNFFSEKNSLEKHLLKKLNLKLFDNQDCKINIIRELLNSEHIRERFNFFSSSELTIDSFLEEVVEYYENNGYKVEYKDIDAMSVIWFEKNKKDRILVTISHAPALAIMVTVNHRDN